MGIRRDESVTFGSSTGKLERTTEIVAIFPFKIPDIILKVE